MTKNEALRALPQTDFIITTPHGEALCNEFGTKTAKAAIKYAINCIRQSILEEKEIYSEVLLFKIAKEYINIKPSPSKVINGTGIILHTNLGRAPLSKKAIEAVVNACGYTDIEFNKETGERGDRAAQTQQLLCEIASCEDAMVVNNNASALLLALFATTNGKAAVVSRGEMVEIGGSFRVNEIMQLCGAPIMEVGTTNRTHKEDYEKAAQSGGAGVLLKVHTSNYKIEGFTCDVSIRDICDIAHKNKLPVIADIGSGVLLPREYYGFDEPSVADAIKAGADIVCFSADKLMGGPQAGVICGKKMWIDKLKAHPFARAARLDKLNLAALNATLLQLRVGEQAASEIPVLQMINKTTQQKEQQANQMLNKLKSIAQNTEISVIKTQNPIGGGSVPCKNFESFAVCIKVKNPQHLALKLRNLQVPIIGYIKENAFVIDVGTLLLGDDEIIVRELKGLI